MKAANPTSLQDIQDIYAVSLQTTVVQTVISPHLSALQAKRVTSAGADGDGEIVEESLDDAVDSEGDELREGPNPSAPAAEEPSVM